MSAETNNSGSSMKDQIKQMLTQAKTEMESLEVQLSLGKAEAVEAFEEQKKALNEKLEEAKKFFGEMAEKGKTQAAGMQQELEKLQVQLSLGKADTVDAFKAQEKEIAASVGAFREQAKGFFSEASAEGEEKMKALWEDMDKHTASFRTRMDMFRVQLSLGEKEAQEEIEKYRKEFLEKTRALGQQLEEKIDVLEDKAEELGEEISEKLNDFKKSFMGMFS